MRVEPHCRLLGDRYWINIRNGTDRDRQTDGRTDGDASLPVNMWFSMPPLPHCCRCRHTWQFLSALAFVQFIDPLATSPTFFDLHC